MEANRIINQWQGPASWPLKPQKKSQKWEKTTFLSRRCNTCWITLPNAFLLMWKRTVKKKKKKLHAPSGVKALQEQEYTVNCTHDTLLLLVAGRLTSKCGGDWTGRSKQSYYQKRSVILAWVITCSPTQFSLALCKGFITLGFSIYKKSFRQGGEFANIFLWGSQKVPAESLPAHPLTLSNWVNWKGPF